MEKFDLIVLGAGPAGYAAAMRGVDFGKKVCLIEAKKVGGAGVYNGALSSKTLWELSSKIRKVNDTIGDNQPFFEIPWSKVRKTIDEAVFERKFQYSCHIKLLQTESMHKLLHFERGYGSFIDRNHIKIVHDGAEKEVWGEKIIIASGSRPRVPENIIVDYKTVHTSDSIEHINDYPKSIVIIGAGVIGCEYATIFSNFGKTKVYLIDRQDRILPYEDKDISNLIAKNFEQKNVTIHHNSQLESLKTVGNGVDYTISHPDGTTETLNVEMALFSIGRIPNVEKLKLENVGVKMSKRGFHIGDDDTVTNIPNIHAVGDASGRIALVNVGEIEGRHAVEKAFEVNKRKLSYDNVCTLMFLHPEVASVGLNEKNCIDQNIPVKVVKVDFSVIARAVAMRQTEGFFKIIVTNDNEMKILGMRAVGEHASTAIQGVALLIQMNAGIEALAELIHPHPSIVEGIQECARMLLNKSLFKSSVFNDKLSCYSLVNGVKTPLQRL